MVRRASAKKAAKSKQLFTTVPLDVGAKFEEIARQKRVEPAQLLRWAVQDITDGLYLPHPLELPKK